MKAVIQRVASASVTVDDKIVGEIQTGLLVLIGIEDQDSDEDISWLSSKIVNMRLFPDSEGVMNLSLLDIGAQILIISQFTLQASTKKGNRPSYIKAAKPEIAIPIYQKFISEVQSLVSQPVQTGIFGADMKVNLLNDGPVTIIMDTKNRF
ncbi:MAG: D-tyrosyl-tRNA(Tyr) deacylase [Flavobacterium sp.]|nr:D-tyrosyl-tRNA(Tyr) deacylase [Flavobacterium sp.]